MATRYWRGGAGTWNTTTNWSTTSGGASGASIPISTDDVVFDANSGLVGNLVSTCDIAFTINNLTISTSATIGVSILAITVSLTVSGTMSCSSTAGNRRFWICGTTYGLGQNLTVATASSLADLDFRDIYVKGTAAPISGTRIGNRGNCTGITFDAAKTVYWNLAGAQNWSANGWAATSGGTPATTNFPLPQDTAVFDNTGSVTGTITLDTAIAYCSTVDMSGRTTAMTLGTGFATTAYGNWTNGSGTAFTGTAALTFSGGTTQTITSAGKTFTSPIIVDTYGGTVTLVGAATLSEGNTGFVLTSGTFDTAGYAFSVQRFTANSTTYKKLFLRASTMTVSGSSGAAFTIGSNLNETVIDAGTSQINRNFSFAGNLTFGGQTFYNVTLSATSAGVQTILGDNTVFNNLTLTPFSSSSIQAVTTFILSNNIIVNGTFTSTATYLYGRGVITSSALFTPITITANTITATNVDFRDITVVATTTTFTGVGDVGGNTGITFPAAITLYWNLATGAYYNGWSLTSGGAPGGLFPLAQDTIVFNNAGALTTCTISAAYFVGTITVTKTTGGSISSTLLQILGDFTRGTISWGSGQFYFAGRGTQIYQSSSTFTFNNIEVLGGGTLRIARALIQDMNQLIITRGNFDANNFNVDTGIFTSSHASNVITMGSGAWTINSQGNFWVMTAGTIIANTAVITSNTTNTVRGFIGGGNYYYKLILGGATGSSTTTFTGNNTFGELASTKPVAHTIAFGTTVQTFGRWSVTGTLGNVVTITGTSTTNVIAGPAVTGVNYLAMGSWGISTTSPGEFYAGVNSTGTAAAPVFRTAAPAPRTLYWVGGTGNWSSTTKWATSSGGASGAAIPTSLDAVIFDSASSGADYTATIDAGVTLARCAAFTMAGPAAGNVTFAGTVGIAFHANVSFAATGITRSYTGAMNWAGNGSYTFTTNGLVLGGTTTITGIGSTWTLGSALSLGTTNFSVTYGTFNTSASNYTITAGSFSSNNSNIRSISLNASALTTTQSPITFTTSTNLTFNAGTSSITSSGNSFTFAGGGQTFYNVVFTSSNIGVITISGSNIFTNLSIPARGGAGISSISIGANQTITGTFTLNAGFQASFRTFLQSDTFNTPRTLTINALAAGAADIDFKDITVTGSAAPLTGTRFGDAKNNSGITFPAGKTVYYAQTGSSSWGVFGGSWSATSGGAIDATMFPLAQDTAVFPATTYPASGSTTTFNASYNVGTIDMSLRTSNTMTLTANANIQVYSNWINGTGITLTGSGLILFAGRTAQQITGAGRTFTQFMGLNSVGGSLTLQDAVTLGAFFQLTNGTLDLNGKTLTVGSTFQIGAGTKNLTFNGSTLAILSTAINGFDNSNPTGFTTSAGTGAGVMSFTSVGNKGIFGGGSVYACALNIAGSGTLSVTGNNTFTNITKTTGSAATINLNATTQKVGAFTATGTVGNLLTITGTSAASPAALIYTGVGTITGLDYFVLNFIRAYSPTTTWYAGNNSTNGGSLGWYFSSGAGTIYAVFITESNQASNSIAAAAVFRSAVSDTVNATDSIAAQEIFGSSISESVTAVDSVSAQEILYPAISETVSVSETNAVSATFLSTVSDTATATDSISSNATFNSVISDTVNVSDSPSAKAVFGSSVSDTVTVTDTPSAAQGFSTTIAEQANASETNSAAQGFGSSISEQVNANDSISAMAMFAGYLNESATASESNSAKAVFGSNVSDSVTVDGSPSTQAIFNSATQDTAQALDSISAAATFRGAVSESAAAQDSDSVAASTFNAAAEDNMQASNIFSGQVSFGATVSNTVNAADSDVGFIRFPSSISESATALDSISAAQRFRTAIMESNQASNIFSAIEVFKSSISETVHASETNSAKAAFGSAVTDTARASETNTGRVRFGSAVNESITITDSDVGFIRFPGSISESAQASEQTSAKAVFTPRFTDGAAASEFVATNFQVNSALLETAQASAINASSQGFGSAVFESATANDSVLARAIFQGIISEAARGSDQFSTSAVFLAAFSEFAQAYAEDVGYLTGSRVISESSTVFDSASAAGALRGYISESTTAVDSIAAKLFYATFINESAQGLDAVDAPGSIYNVITSEQAAVNGSPSANAIFYAAVIAYAGITDIATARYLWELIDNDQTSDWSNINDTQSAGWVEVNDIQAASWQNVGNTQSSGWTEINDTQNPGWERITP